MGTTVVKLLLKRNFVCYFRDLRELIVLCGFEKLPAHTRHFRGWPDARNEVFVKGKLRQQEGTSGQENQSSVFFDQQNEGSAIRKHPQRLEY